MSGAGRRSAGAAGAVAARARRAAGPGWGVFLDRDGTLLRLVPYLRDPERARLYAGVGTALRALRAAGARLVVVTNQAGVARGLLTRADAARVNAALKRLLAGEGVRLDAIETCFHHPDFTGPCDCRKPAPGMILKAAQRLGLDPAASWTVGDSGTDIEAGRVAGTRTALVLTGYGRGTSRTAAGRRADVVTGTLAAAARRILAAKRRARVQRV